MSPDTTGTMSYSCVFYSHQFCDGTADHTDHPEQGPSACACPCHQHDVATKAA